MSGEILVGEGRKIRRASDEAFVKAMEKLPERMEARLRFMTREHHAVRDFVARELPRCGGRAAADVGTGAESKHEAGKPQERSFALPATAGRLRMTSPSGSAEEKLLAAAAAACRPISARQIAGVTGLDERRVKEILAELEKHLFFLVRNAEGEVSWAFPVTTEGTEHRLTFSSGEKIFGA